ncbi:MAG: hypothetical protein ACQEP7_06245 [bacterium]
MQIVSFVLFLLLLLAVYITFSREQKEYEQIEEVMEEEEQKELNEEESKKALWQGIINNYPVIIQRGVDFRDSNRLITITVKARAPVELRVDPYNILRHWYRLFNESLGSRHRIKLEGPLDNFLVYSSSPAEARRFLEKFNSPEYTDILREFHHVDFLEEKVKGWFYQLDVDIEEIKTKARKFTTMLENRGIKAGEIEN